MFVNNLVNIFCLFKNVLFIILGINVIAVVDFGRMSISQCFANILGVLNVSLTL